MNVSLLNPWFAAKFYYEGTVKSFRMARVDGSPVLWAESQGLSLWCPCGYGLLDKEGKEMYPLDLSFNKGRPHGLLIPFSNPPSGVQLPVDHGPLSRDGKSHPRWTATGTSLNDITLTPSVAVGPIGSECWHGFIRNGDVTNA